jgi:tryptophanase
VKLFHADKIDITCITSSARWTEDLFFVGNSLKTIKIKRAREIKKENYFNLSYYDETIGKIKENYATVYGEMQRMWVTAPVFTDLNFKKLGGDNICKVFYHFE